MGQRTNRTDGVCGHLGSGILSRFDFFPSFFLTCFEKTAMSSLNDSDEQTSPPATEGSLGVHVASSHFSKIRANRGNSGWLKWNERETQSESD